MHRPTKSRRTNVQQHFLNIVTVAESKAKAQQWSHDDLNLIRHMPRLMAGHHRRDRSLPGAATRHQKTEH
jgi:hypothetical protein